jgi:hypothetical protein
MSLETVHNAYPDLPELSFVRTTISMAEVVDNLYKRAIIIPVKCASYVIFRNESAEGKKGINNNYIGLQADGDRQEEKWTPLFAGTCTHAENMTGKLRRFICFKDWTTCVDILADKVKSRGLYVGGYAHPYANMPIERVDDWPLAYWREWVVGDDTASMPESEKENLLGQYSQGLKKFESR